jgi:hypothetical protein
LAAIMTFQPEDCRRIKHHIFHMATPNVATLLFFRKSLCNFNTSKLSKILNA